jgi:acyl carrier protein
MPSAETLDRVTRVIRESLRLAPETPMPADMPLVGGDYDLDSLDMLLVVTNIEKEFAIKISERELGKQVFESVRSLATFVDSRVAR